MKQLLLFLFMAANAFTALAQFPLGSDKGRIKTYFDDNIPYSIAQEFRSSSGVEALCFTKVKIVGDYTFYFNSDGLCTSYVVTYDKRELAGLVQRFDSEFNHISSTKWTGCDETFDVTLLPPKRGENFFSIVYKPMLKGLSTTNTLASY